MSVRLETVIGERFETSAADPCFWWQGAWYDHAFLKNLADTAEATLRASGFSEGQRLVALMPNTPMFLALAIAIWRLGGSLCPLNVKSGIPSLIATLSLLEPFAVVLSEETRKDIETALNEKNWVSVTCPPMGPLPAFSGRSTTPEGRELAVIFSTSGTTGTPKAVPITHENMLSNCQDCVKILEDLRPGDVFLNVLPNFHSFGLTTGTMLPLVAKCGQAIVPGFLPPSQTLKAIIEAPVDIAIVVPAMLSFLLGILEREGRKLQGIKMLVAGGDKYNSLMDPKVEELMGVGVMEGYGITECTPVVAVNGSYRSRKLGTVGRFLDSYAWQLRNEDGTIADGNEGVLWVKGPSVTSGYFRVTETGKERFDDGWFNTGDYVRVEGGYVQILDRVTDIIIVGGFNVYPQEVEAVLHTHPAVQTAVVVGVPNINSGEYPMAYIQKKPDAEVSEPELVRYCKDQLAHYKVPRKVEFVESMPLSATGKVLRRVLRQQSSSRS